MTPEDYEEMTANLVGFDEDGEKTIDFAAFDQLIRKELRAFAQRNLGLSPSPFATVKKNPALTASIPI